MSLGPLQSDLSNTRSNVESRLPCYGQRLQRYSFLRASHQNIRTQPGRKGGFGSRTHIGSAQIVLWSAGFKDAPDNNSCLRHAYIEAELLNVSNISFRWEAIRLERTVQRFFGCYDHSDAT